VLSLCIILFTTKHFILPRTKALFTAGVPLKMAHGLEEYIFNRFVAGENTLYQNVKVLPDTS
jgi:5-keto 4-deoxyuronate isomerase